MQREDHRCIATRILDRQSAVDLRDLTGEVYKGVVASLEVCHIFVEPTNMDDIEDELENKVGVFLGSIADLALSSLLEGCQLLRHFPVTLEEPRL